MHLRVKNLKLQFDIIKEGRDYIAYSPALDLATSGRTIAEAKRMFKEAVELFFETIIENGSFKDTLSNLGWQVSGKKLTPPLIIGRDVRTVSLSLA